MRIKLPETRNSITHKFNVNGYEGFITVGMYPDGSPGELFIRMAKEGSTVGGLCEMISILTSFCLQAGVPVKELVEKFHNTCFEPSGGTINRDIPIATSIIDYIFTWMGIQFDEEFRKEHFGRLQNCGKCSNSGDILGGLRTTRGSVGH